MGARLGDILVAQGAIARERIEALTPRPGSRIGEFLRAHDLIGQQALARALAEQHGLAYADLNQADTTLYQPRDLAHYQQWRYVPFAREGGSLTIVCTDPTRMLLDEVTRRTGYAVTLAITSPRDLSKYLLTRGGNAASRQARLSLRRLHPHLTAARTLLPSQLRGLVLITAFLIGVFMWNMHASWQWLLIGCNLFYFAALAFKLQLYSRGLAGAQAMQKLSKQLEAQVAALRDEQLPIYSILVPMYKESAEVMARLITHLSALDYPKEKLDIKLICEADDVATLEALTKLRPPQTMEILRVPPSQPRTKPKACNVALQQIRGQYLVIFDAEDAPAPDQLKRAVCLFDAASSELACVQAPLNYYNRQENLLTQCFALEYSALFRLLLPALERMQLPIPLGGTSNHLRVSALREAGGWDAFNVTEDADLGIRLAYFGYRTRVLPSLTLEEAPITLRAWMCQRTRWIKGYIQTWLVYMRDPAEFKRRLGSRAYYGFQFFVGAPALTFLLSPILWLACLTAPLGLLPTQLSPLMLMICAISFVGGVGSHWLYAHAVLRLEKWDGMGRAMLVFPFYWLLHSVACARALWQLARAPHYWEKTTHGVSHLFKK